jgi:hypothetical protein
VAQPAALTAFPDETLRQPARRFASEHVTTAVVLSRADLSRIVGLITVEDRPHIVLRYRGTIFQGRYDMPAPAHSRYHDVRREGAGGFAGAVEPAAPFGKFAGPPRRRWQAAGGFAGWPDAQRQGTFADVEGRERGRRR